MPALQKRLSLEQRLARSELHEAGFLAALEGLPMAAFLLSSNGTLLQSNALGRARFDHVGRRVDEELSDSLRGAAGPTPFQMTRLASGSTHWFLAVQRARPRDATESAYRAQVRYGLTRRQTAVQLGLVNGSSNRRIAREPIAPSARSRCT